MSRGAEKLILWGSQYGTAERYARALSQRTGIPARAWENAGPLNELTTLIHIGGLYAGGVLGLTHVLKQWPQQPDRRLIIATVGLADPGNPQNIASIRASLTRQLKGQWAEAQVFFLRGGMDYAKLNLKHRTMMALLYRKAKGQPPDEQTPEVQAMIATYGKQVDFVDLNALAPLEAVLREENCL